MPLILIRDKVDTDYLLKIDKKIAALASRELDNVRLGFTNKINYNDLDVLTDLRDIFISKSYGSDCWCDTNMSEIKFYIDKITNKNC